MMTTLRRIEGDAATRESAIAQAVACLRGGGLAVLPTETIYGVAADAASDIGYAALRAFKGGAADQTPFSLHVADRDAALRFVDGEHPALRRLMRKVMPGPVTLLVQTTRARVAAALAGMGVADLGAAVDRVYRDETIGLRCPDHELTRAVLATAGTPIIAGSVTQPGQAPALDADAAAAAVGEAAGIVLDGGRCRFSQPSTVLQVATDGPRLKVQVQRSGVYDERFIGKLLRWTILLVCTGNTCRSPMAQVLAGDLLAKRYGVAADDLEAVDVRVVSAGIAAGSGMPASPEAVAVLRRRGLDLSKHRSRALSLELLNEADLVLTMTNAHRQAILESAAHLAGKVLTLDPQGDVADPIGGPESAYERAAAQIESALRIRLKE
jgi:protein-tyrosine phosphatase